MTDYFGSVVYTAAPSPTPDACALTDSMAAAFNRRFMGVNDTGDDQYALYLTASQGTDQIVFDALIASTASNTGCHLGYSLGLVTAGEIRSGTGSPGGGFSGGRFGTSPTG